jgi:hypothetical protein
MHFFRKEPAALLQKPDVARDAFNLSKVMAGEKDGRLWSSIQQAFDQFISHQRIQSGKRFIQHNQ